MPALHRREGSVNKVPVTIGRINGQIMQVIVGFLGPAGAAIGMDVEVVLASRGS